MTTVDQSAADGARSALVAACARAELTRGTLYLRYIGLGGRGSSSQVADHCSGGATLPVIEHNVLVQAINERFLEVGNAERVGFL